MNKVYRRNKQQTNEMGSRDHVRYIRLEGQFITQSFMFCDVECIAASMAGNGSKRGNVCRPVYVHKSNSFAHTHTVYTVQYILYECDLQLLITSLLSYCVLDPVSEIMNRIIIM